ncbi:MAG: Asp-tRNA(Asn)/Glu-tRNA(Gln) amidotransferase subunit GatB [Mycoplasma sp.]
MNNKYKINIGIEIHCTLNTLLKLFSPSVNLSAILVHKELNKFIPKKPNTTISPLDLGYPGYMPIPNEEAVQKALMACLILNAHIAEELRFDRKHYFYPDLPKGYQITQFYNPIGVNGNLEIILENGIKKRISISKIILEEDTASMIHHGQNTKIDYNRAGNPLLEIVSSPDISNSYEAVEYIKELRRKLIFANISFARFELGQFRCDLNVSVSEKNSDKMGTRIEIKNLNSLANIKKAIDNEVEELIDLLESNEKIRQQTKRFDESTQKNKFMRFKETEIDYKYLRDPMFGLYKLNKIELKKYFVSLTNLVFEYFDRKKIDEMIELSNFWIFIEILGYVLRYKKTIPDKAKEISQGCCQNKIDNQKEIDDCKKEIDDYYLFFTNFINQKLNKHLAEGLSSYHSKLLDTNKIINRFEDYMRYIISDIDYIDYLFEDKKNGKFANIDLLKNEIDKWFTLIISLINEDRFDELHKMLGHPPSYHKENSGHPEILDDKNALINESLNIINFEESIINNSISRMNLNEVLPEYKNRPDRVINGIFGQIMKNNKEHIEKINPASLKQRLQDKLNELVKKENK